MFDPRNIQRTRKEKRGNLLKKIKDKDPDLIKILSGALKLISIAKPEKNEAIKEILTLTEDLLTFRKENEKRLEIFGRILTAAAYTDKNVYKLTRKALQKYIEN